MTPVRRWCLVALAGALLVTAPVALRQLPAGGTGVDAGTVLSRARASLDASWSGSVETEGALQVPDADGFGDVASMFGERTTLRAWWRDREQWRVDRLAATGETDVYRDGDITREWDYESLALTVSRDPDIRLPRSGDLLPPVLAERLLRGVSEADTSRLSTVRIAGRTAVGLRVRPPSPLTSIDRVDLWADEASGVPLLVRVYAAGATAPDFTSSFTSFSPDPPSGRTVGFRATALTDVSYDDVLDIADAANQYAHVRPPATAAGLALADASDGAVGVYGRGAAQVVAIPLRDREADTFREQMALTPGVAQDRERTVVALGPLGILLTGEPGDGGWLLAGTLTLDALERAGADVVSGAVAVEDHR